MMYTVYEEKGYLIPIAKGVEEDALTKFGEIDAEIFDNYSDKNPKRVGFKIKAGLKKLYAIRET